MYYKNRNNKMDGRSKHPFAITCRKCGGNDITVIAYEHQDLGIRCNHCGYELDCETYYTKKYERIAVTWMACGFIEVEADNIEDAMNKVRENPDDYPLPYDGGEYVDGSFGLSTDDVDEMKAICEF